MRDLIQSIFVNNFSNNKLARLQGPAQCYLNYRDDSPLRQIRTLCSLYSFPGGDIGSLAVHGTINDLAMSGAIPKYLSAGFILEEGLEILTLKRVVESMADAARTCRVEIVCGDTKNRRSG